MNGPKTTKSLWKLIARPWIGCWSNHQEGAAAGEETAGRLRIILLLAVLGVLAGAPAAAAFKYVEVGQPAPELSVDTVSGKPAISIEKSGAKALAVVFWALWSPRSRTMLDDLDRLYRMRKDQGFQVVAVNVEHEVITESDRKEIEGVAQEWQFPVVVDRELTTYYRYGVVAVPSLALVDEDGVVRYERASYSSSARADIRQAVDALLGLESEQRTTDVVRRTYVPPKKATLHYQKAQVLQRRGQDRRAVRDLVRAAELDPKWAAPRLALARLHLAKADRDASGLDRADARLREVLEIRPDHLQALALRAEVAARREDPQTALELAGRALDQEPAYTPALLVKAQSLQATDRTAEARAVLEKARNLDRRNPRILRQMGELAASEGDWKGASTALREAVEMALSAASPSAP